MFEPLMFIVLHSKKKNMVKTTTFVISGSQQKYGKVMINFYHLQAILHENISYYISYYSQPRIRRECAVYVFNALQTITPGRAAWLPIDVHCSANSQLGFLYPVSNYIFEA